MARVVGAIRQWFVWFGDKGSDTGCASYDLGVDVGACVVIVPTILFLAYVVAAVARDRVVAARD
jgi:hypothetical protein